MTMWNDPICRAVLPKHLPQVSDKLVGLLVCSEVTSFRVLGLKN